MERSNLTRLVTWVVYRGRPAAIKLNLNQSCSVAPHWNKCYATWSKSGPPWSTPLPLASTLEWPAWALSSMFVGHYCHHVVALIMTVSVRRRGEFEVEREISRGFFGERGYMWLGCSFFCNNVGTHTYIATSFDCVSPSAVLLLLVRIWLLLLQFVSCIEGHTARLWGIKRANIRAWNVFNLIVYTFALVKTHGCMLGIFLSCLKHIFLCEPTLGLKKQFNFDVRFIVRDTFDPLILCKMKNRAAPLDSIHCWLLSWSIILAFKTSENGITVSVSQNYTLK